MGDEKRILDSHTLYPTMMQTAKLLVLDYDVTRYHSLDFFRYLLRHKDWFVECDPLYIPFMKEPDPIKQLMFYMRKCPYENPCDNFIHHRDMVTVSSLEDSLNEQFEHMYITPTEVDIRLGIIFDRPNISGYLLKYKKDPHNAMFSDKVKVYTSDHILDLRMALAIIERHQINAIMVSSVDVAIALAIKIVQHNLPTPVSFIIGTYFYNYDQEYRILKNIPIMNRLEYLYKFEFGVFDPYTGLNEQRKEGVLNEFSI